MLLNIIIKWTEDLAYAYLRKKIERNILENLAVWSLNFPERNEIKKNNNNFITNTSHSEFCIIQRGLGRGLKDMSIVGYVCIVTRIF